MSIRPGITMAEVVDTFRQFQDFINAKDQIAGMSAQDLGMCDRRRKKALNILLYGVVAREGESHVI